MSSLISLTNLASEPLLYNGQHIMVGETFLVSNYEYNWATQDIIDDINSSKVSAGDGTAQITDSALAIKYLQTLDASVFERYDTEVYNSKNLISSKTWYTYKSDIGVYSGKVKEVVYTYDDKNLVSATESYYYLDGSLKSQTTETYYTDKSNKKYHVERS